MCFSTVRGESCSRAAISLLEMPSATSRSTSACRSVMPSLDQRLGCGCSSSWRQRSASGSIPWPGERVGRGLQPLPRLAPAVSQRRLGGAKPGQVGPYWVVPQFAIRGDGQFGGLVLIPGAPGEDRVGVAEDSSVDPVDGQADPPRAADRGRRICVAVRGQQQRPYRAVWRWALLGQGVEDGDAAAEALQSARPVVVEQRQHPVRAGQRAAFDFWIAGFGGMGEREKAIHARAVTAQCLYLGEEEQPDGARLGQPEPGTGGQRGLGVMFGLAELEAEHRDGGELQVDDRAGTGRAQLIGDTPSLGEAVGAGVVEHVDGAELMQGTQPPHGQPCRIRGRQGLLEGLPGSIQIFPSQDAAEQFERMAADLRTRLRRGQGALGEGASPVDVVVGEGDLGAQDGRLGGEAGLRIGREQVAGDAELPPRGRPPGPVHRRVGQLQMHRRPGRRPSRDLAAAGR